MRKKYICPACYKEVESDWTETGTTCPSCENQIGYAKSYTDYLTVEINKLRAENAKLREALEEIYEACMAADEDENLSDRIDGDMLDRARAALDGK